MTGAEAVCSADDPMPRNPSASTVARCLGLRPMTLRASVTRTRAPSVEPQRAFGADASH